jgi:hypothetical protein
LSARSAGRLLGVWATDLYVRRYSGRGRKHRMF